MIERHFGTRSVNSDIIHNGTYVSRLALKNVTYDTSWLKHLRQDFDKIFVASSQWTNRPHKRLDENIRFVAEYSQWSSDTCCLITLGDSDKFQPGTELEYSKYFTQIHVGNMLPSEAWIPLCFADWFIHLAYADHSPNVLVNALAIGVASICSSYGGQSELIENITLSQPRGVIVKEQHDMGTELHDYRKPPI